MPIVCCINCAGEVRFDDLILSHHGSIIGGVCAKCVVGVKKPRVTLTRDSREGQFVAEQYSAVEVYR